MTTDSISPRPAAVPIDRVALAVMLAAFLGLYLPVYAELANTVWATDEQGHGPIILAVGLWLIYKRWLVEPAGSASDSSVFGWPVAALSLLLYTFGKSQDILLFSVGSQIGVLAAMVLLLRGKSALRAVAFPLAFLLFMVPLPEALVAAVTGPLKSAVSAVASSLLYAIGYPVGRSGVVLTVGQYQLLVADACAGLNSMFTLEALGLLYMNLMGYKSFARNLALAIILIPLAFVANIVRVMVLVLVTYHFGDEAGQGFVHGFAGMVLFAVALVLMLVADWLLGHIFKSNRGSHEG